MKKLLIILIILLIPAFLFARGSKPSSTATVSGTVDVGTVTTLPAVTGTVTANVVGDVGIDNFTSLYPVNDDSINTGTISAGDTVVVTMSTGVAFTNQQGFFVYHYAPNATTDSVVIQYSYPVLGGWSRYLPMYPDTNRTDGNEMTYVKSTVADEYVENKYYPALLFDPATTNPMSYFPMSGDKIRIRFINSGSSAVTFVSQLKWQ